MMKRSNPSTGREFWVRSRLGRLLDPGSSLEAASNTTEGIHRASEAVESAPAEDRPQTLNSSTEINNTTKNSND